MTTEPRPQIVDDEAEAASFKYQSDPEDQTPRLFDVKDVVKAKEIAALYKRYLVPPFTILDRRQGYWKERVQQWKALGIESELGRSAIRKNSSNSGVWGDFNEGITTYSTKESIGDYPKTQGMSKEDAEQRQAQGRKSKGEASVATMSHLTGGKKFKKDGDKIVQEGYSGNYSLARDASIFDPVVCELAYHWFCPPGGLVLDPFAGGSVRGIVSAAMGRRYVGIDLSGPQCVANRVQAERIFPTEEERPIWVEGDSKDVLTGYMGDEADLLFTCPPYGDLEVYSDDPRDLSTMNTDGFIKSYFEILEAAVFAMKQNSFLVIVVGNYRDRKSGVLNDLVGTTVRACHSAGADYYNEAVIIDPIGTAAVRAPGVFQSARKLVRTHQNFLVFSKGDPKVATEPLVNLYDTEDIDG